MSEIVLTTEAAKIAGVSAVTIRYWEQTGRLHAEKTTNGTRLFNRRDVEQLAQARAKAQSATVDAGMAAAG